jgi:hypothetical protein
MVTSMVAVCSPALVRTKSVRVAGDASGIVLKGILAQPFP